MEHRSLNPGLTLVVRVAMYTVAAFSLASCLATFNEIGAFDDLVDRVGDAAQAELADAEQVSEGFAALAFWIGAATGGVTIVWWYRSYQAIQRAEPVGLSWSPRWAVGGWFIPLANAVIPKLVLNEIDRVSQAAEAGRSEWKAERLTVVANWWWALWIGGVALTFLGASMVTGETVAAAFDPSTYRTGLVVTTAGFGASCVAGFLGAATVRVIGERLEA